MQPPQQSQLTLSPQTESLIANSLKESAAAQSKIVDKLLDEMKSLSRKVDEKSQYPPQAPPIIVNMPRPEAMQAGPAPLRPIVVDAPAATPQSEGLPRYAAADLAEEEPERPPRRRRSDFVQSEMPAKRESSQAGGLVLEPFSVSEPEPEVEWDPEPLSLETEPLPMETEPLPMETEPLSLEPEPPSLEPKPLSLEPEPLSLEPEPLSLEPEPLSLEPETEPTSDRPPEPQPTTQRQAQRRATGTAALQPSPAAGRRPGPASPAPRPPAQAAQPPAARRPASRPPARAARTPAPSAPAAPRPAPQPAAPRRAQSPVSPAPRAPVAREEPEEEPLLPTEPVPTREPGKSPRTGEDVRQELRDYLDGVRDKLDKGGAARSHPGDLLDYLEKLSDYLPERDKKRFRGSNERLAMESLKAQLAGKKGLRQKIAEDFLPVVPHRKEPMTRSLIVDTFSYLKDLSAWHPDKAVAAAMRERIESVVAQMGSLK